jgi:hypothetical protein
MSTASGRPRPRKTDLILLVDRCLAPEVAYEISKMDGLYGIPLHEHYGDGAAQRLDDITFLAEAGQRGWGILTQNPRMWQVPQERTCIVDNHTRVFSLGPPQRQQDAQRPGAWPPPAVRPSTHVASGALFLATAPTSREKGSRLSHSAITIRPSRQRQSGPQPGSWIDLL